MTLLFNSMTKKHYLFVASNMQIVRSWREQKILLKRIFPVINDEDFALEDKDRETMLDKLAAKLDKTRAQLELVFADLQRY